MMHTVFAIVYFLSLNRARGRNARVREIWIQKVTLRRCFKTLGITNLMSASKIRAASECILIYQLLRCVLSCRSSDMQSEDVECGNIFGPRICSLHTSSWRDDHVVLHPCCIGMPLPLPIRYATKQLKLVFDT
jgi:hypothetical protein